MIPTNERLDRRRRRTVCDVREFDRDCSSAATIDDLRLDRRRSRNVLRPSAFIGGLSRCFDDVDEPAPRSVSTMDVSSGVCSCRC